MSPKWLQVRTRRGRVFYVRRRKVVPVRHRLDQPACGRMIGHALIAMGYRTQDPQMRRMGQAVLCKTQMNSNEKVK